MPLPHNKCGILLPLFQFVMLQKPHTLVYSQDEFGTKKILRKALYLMASC